MVCAAVFGMHVAVCAYARVWLLPGGLLPSQQEAEYSFSGFIPTNKQTNKKTSVGKGFIQFVYGSHSKRGHEAHLIKKKNRHLCAQVFLSYDILGWTVFFLHA